MLNTKKIFIKHYLFCIILWNVGCNYFVFANSAQRPISASVSNISPIVKGLTPKLKKKIQSTKLKISRQAIAKKLNKNTEPLEFKFYKKSFSQDILDVTYANLEPKKLTFSASVSTGL